MKIAALCGLVWFMVTSLAVGVRLIALWRRTRQLPELLLATGLLCTGFLSFAMSMIGKLFGAPGSPLRLWLPIGGPAVEASGCIALVVFAWKVFHPDARWAKALATALVALMVAGLAGELLSGQYIRYGDALPSVGPWIPLGLASRGLAPTWMAFESWRYFGMLRRRARLGLAEPLVVNRFALYGVAMTATVAAYTVTVAHRAVLQTGLAVDPWAFGLVSLLASVSAVGIGLGFFPPRFYRRWIAPRAISDT